MEVAKNKVQAHRVATPGSLARNQGHTQSTLGVLRAVVKADGFAGLFRGLGPGAARSFVANGTGMAVYQLTQALRED